MASHPANWRPNKALQAPPERDRSMTKGRLDVIIRTMENSKRATVYFTAEVHKALRLRAAASDRSISDMVNDAVRVAWLKTTPRREERVL